MKYAIVTPADQTIMLWSECGGWTTRHPDATLYDTELAAQVTRDQLNANVDPRVHCFVENVADEAEFRSREDTW